jgi:hypothetical protein
LFRSSSSPPRCPAWPYGQAGRARRSAAGGKGAGKRRPTRPEKARSLPVAELEDTASVRLALAACARNLAGKPAGGPTQRRKRSVFYNALGCAVEEGHLPANPVDRI